MAIFAIVTFGMIAILTIPALLMDMTQRMYLGILALLILGIGGYLGYQSDAFQNRYWLWGLPTLPNDETAFISTANGLRGAEEGTPGTARTAALQAVKARVCALPVVAANWFGRIEFVYPTGSGSLSLAIRVAPHLVLRTALFPDQSGTLVPTGSPLFGQLSAVPPGDAVRFSGSFADRDGNCADASPDTTREELRDPDFLFRFTQLAVSPKQ